MKYNGKNIIFDQDVTITNTNHIGENLSQVINKLDQDVNSLKSNVNWIYKYGGVGSGTGNGSGTTSPWNFKVELDDVIQEHNSTVNLGLKKEYKLLIRLYKIQGRTFTIKCTHTTNSGIRIIERIISPDQNPLLEETIDLQVNGTLTIAINDDEGNFDLFVLNYIVSAYDFKLYYTNNNHIIYNPQNHNIFVNEIEESGLLAALEYSISVDISEHSYIKYTNWNNETFEESITKGLGCLYLNLGKDITNDNSGNYTFLVEIHLILDGKTEEEIIPIYKLQDNLIPSTIYLKVETDGIIYSDNSNENPYLFYAGSVPFRVTPFLGYPDANSNYSIEAYLNEEPISLNYTQLTDLKPHTLNIITDKLGWNTITFNINRKGLSFTKTYYFNTKSPLGSFAWYPSYEINNIITIAKPKYSYQYKYSGKIYEGTYQIPKTNQNSLISKNLLLGTSSYECSFSEDIGSMDCLLSVGIKYDELNDITKPIMKFSGVDSSNDITIYQDKVIILNSNLEIYLPKLGFHLLSIYRRTVSTQSGSPLFEYNIYIDGCLEAATGTFNGLQEKYNKIYLYKALYDINYLEISYFEHNIVNNENPFYKYNLNPQTTALKYLDDSGILYHYYSYKLTFEPESIPENFQEVYAYVSQFYNDFYKNRIVVNETLIRNISEKVNIPVLVLEYTEPRTNLLNWSSDGETFFSWLEGRYDITNNLSILNQANKVKVYWSKGLQSLSEIKTDANTQFQITLQGTSTLLYGSKNLDLAITSNDEEHTYLYSPNFNPEDDTTFLPETRFTLKADVVDSSHSNNNSLGKFINTVSTKFTGAKQHNSKYSSYIKNTIEGFPILLFLNNKYYINSTKETAESDFYFLGIYNFNLGRESEYNLGYKDLRLLPDNIEQGFAITKINNDIKLSDGTDLNAKSYLSGFGVAEIRENRNYFDFSQSDRSILFPVSDTDNDYMFGKIKSNSQLVFEKALIDMVDAVRRSSGYIFDQLGKNMLDDGGYTEGYKSVLPQNLVPNYKITMKRNFKDAASELIPLKGLIEGNPNNLSITLLGQTDENVLPIIDYKSLSEYYVICMAFGLVDSVMKNLNLKTWNNRTFYTAFYDIDTGLKKDNAGNNTDYKAFSDFWKANSEELGGSTFLRPAISYKDWYDKDVHGFDVPMTYLLALAKYAYLYIRDNETIEYWYPNNIWARMRRSTTKIPTWNAPEDIAHIGVLPNADTFINNFYKNHLEKIPDVFFNLNYRKKYFILDTEEKQLYITEDYKKFSGRRIYAVRDWLNSRFHLLDLYFNLANVPDSIRKYNMSTKEWEYVLNSDYAKTSEIFIDNTNSDIIVLKDIFSASSANTKYSSNININITAEDNSPVCLSGEVIGRYIIEDSLKLYNLSFESAGKGLNLGGSSNWITVNSINTLIQGKQFSVNSNKLTTLTGSSGECSAWSINLPALQTVNLTGPLYSGDLNFTYSESGNRWVNLSDINISGSKLGLILDNINVKSVNADNVSFGNILSITNCKYLQTLSLKNSKFTTINLSPKESVCYFSDYTYERNLKDEWEVTDTPANSPKCKYLSLTSDNDGVIFIGNQQYLRGNDYEGLEEITLDGFTEIYIDKCDYLRKIQINKPEKVTKFIVTNCGNNSTGISINSDSTLTVDLSLFSKLTEIYFYNSKKFTKVIVPDNIALKEYAFFNTNIKYLQGNNITLSKGAFERSNSFTLTQDESGQLCGFNKNNLYKNSTDFSSIFYACNIKKDVFDDFNKEYSLLLEKATITSNMWGYNSNLSYTLEDLQNDYDNNKCSYDLSMYTNVTNASNMFNNSATSGMFTCHPKMFDGFGENSTSINISNIFGWSEKKEVSIPINWLLCIGDKVTNINTGTDSATRNIIYKVISDSNSKNTNLMFEFNPKKLFRGDATGTKGCSNITTLCNWNFDKNHTIDLKDCFNTFDKLTTIKYSFCGCKCKNFEYTDDDGNEKGFLYDSTNKIINIVGSFGFTNFNDITVKLENFINWNNLPNNNKLFLYAASWDELKNVMSFKKTIDNINNFVNIFKILIEKYTGSSLAHVFKNCTITVQENDITNIKFINDIKNTYITEIPYLFSNFKISNNKGINWDWDMFKILPNIKNLKHCFEYMHFTNPIPFNAFNKRKRENILNKFVKIDDLYKDAKLITFTYTKEILNMSYCFLECKFDNPTFNTFEKFYSLTDVNSAGFAYIEDDDSILVEHYYDNFGMFATEKTVDNSEFDDLVKESVYSSSISNNDEMKLLIEKINSDETKAYLNFELYVLNDINHPFVSPDIFYGCTASADLTGCFAKSTLLGYIPDSLFKNCKTAYINNFIDDLLIFPKKLKIAYDINLLLEYNLAYYIGSNFINTLNLDNAFNFKLSLPGNISDWISINPNAEGVKSKSRDLFIFCFTDSFSENLESASNMYPLKINTPPENHIFIVQNNYNDVLLATMYNYLDENIELYEINGVDQEFTILGSFGFDVSKKYKKLNCDNLINNLFIQFGFDRIFDEFTTLDSIKLKLNKNCIITFGNSERTFGASNNIILPYARTNKYSYLDVRSLAWSYDSGSLNESSLGYGIKIKKELISDYKEGITDDYYNNSRKDLTGYKLIFV